MGLQEAVDVRRTRDFDIVSGLQDIDTIKLGCKALIFKRDCLFLRLLEKFADPGINFISDDRVGSRKEKIIDLAKDQDLDTIINALIDVRLMGGVGETEFGT